MRDGSEFLRPRSALAFAHALVAVPILTSLHTRRGSNPQLFVLETNTLPIELRVCIAESEGVEPSLPISE